MCQWEGALGGPGSPSRAQPEREVTDSRIGRKSAWTFSGRVLRQGRAEGAERPPHRRVTAEKAVAPQSPLENYASSVFLQRGENPEQERTSSGTLSARKRGGNRQVPAPRGRCLLRAAGLQRASHSSLCGVSARQVGGEGEPGATHKLSLFQFPSFPPLPLVTFPRGPLQRRRRRKKECGASA